MNIQQSHSRYLAQIQKFSYFLCCPTLLSMLQKRNNLFGQMYNFIFKMKVVLCVWYMK
jgi:hypothetical protein